MSRNKKPRKQYRPGRSAANVALRAQPWKLYAAFDPIEALLTQIETTGSVTSTWKGTPIFLPPGESEWVEISSAIEGFIDTFGIHEYRSGQQIDMKPMKQLANKLKYGSPIYQRDIDASRVCVSMLRQIASGFPAGYAKDLVQSVQIKHELEALTA